MIRVTGPVGDRGVYYNAVNALFNIKDERAEFARYDISVSLLEIYNENVFDLLHTPPKREGRARRLSLDASARMPLQIKSDACGQVIVPQLSQHLVRSPHDVLQLIDQVRHQPLYYLALEDDSRPSRRGS